jgi:uncharacterized protein (UPF0276 family)
MFPGSPKGEAPGIFFMVCDPKNLNLGIGVGYRPSFRNAFLQGSVRPDVSYIEVITENYFPGNERALQTLRQLRTHYPVALHGVGLNLASTDPLDERYLANLKNLSDEIQPWLVTDHLCWTGVNRENLFDLFPFPFTPESLVLVAANVARVQDLLKRHVAVENITYYAHPEGDLMAEEEFLNELCSRTGCRLLLDVNNVYVNAKNFGLDPRAYFLRLELKNVAEIHLAGHFERSDGTFMDTHGAPVKNEVWELYRHVIERAGLIPTMIERDQNIPAWSEMEAEIALLSDIRKGAKDVTRVAEANL